MKIEIKERGSREYYNEILYIASKYKKIIKNPKTKVNNFTKSKIIYSIIAVLVILAYIYLYYIYNDVLFIFLSGIISFALLYNIMYLININKRIDIFMNEEGIKEITLKEDKIIFKDKNKELSVDWDNVKYIIINKYSTSIIPNVITLPIISVENKYNKKIVDSIKKYNKESLLINNLN